MFTYLLTYNQQQFVRAVAGGQVGVREAGIFVFLKLLVQAVQSSYNLPTNCCTFDWGNEPVVARVKSA